MNFIFCKVWSRRLGTWVVASELAKGGKKQVRKASSAVVPTMIITLVLGASFTSGLHAQTVLNCTNDATGSGRIQCGTSADAGADNASAFGNSAKATGMQSTAVGDQTLASGGQSTAIGAGAAGTATAATAIGFQSLASVQNATALGYQAKATNTNATALGKGATAGGTGAIAVGGNATGSANAAAVDSISIGAQSSVAAIATSGVAMGHSATVTAANGIALGNGASASVARSVALGDGATTAAAIGTASTVIRGTTYNFAGVAPVSTVSVGAAGAERTVTNLAAGRLSGASTDAINGSQLFATNQAVQNLVASGSTIDQTAVKYDWNDANGNGAVDPGELNYNRVTFNPGGAGATTLTNVATGTLSATSTDAVNGSQLFQTNQNVAALGTRVTTNEGDIAALNAVVGPTDQAYQDTNGHGVRYVRTNPGLNAQSDAFATGASSTAVGYNARAAADETIAIGENALANALSGLAFGSGSEATAQYAIAIGDESTASGDFSLALGDTANASGESSVAMGSHTVASASGATALGTEGNAAGLGALALGYRTNASAFGATAIGMDSQVSNAGSVALGSNSVADGATLGEAAYVPDASTYPVARPFASSEVSIGKTGSERRLSNVAAGAVDTDAVNVSQLKAVDSKITSLGQDSLLWDPTANGGAGAYSANHGGTGPNKIVNVAPADLSAASTDAVNGSQLFATNQAVQAAGAGFTLTAQGANGSNVDPSESIDLKNG
ncbi:ESPR-type extended signal peptide-containing protein, partial [Pseudomonas sp. CGJS7]|uniref:ESPR-type extended signal peptide-containing protein n=1 Tax=Pseudomonas sp. CGJS7 TaxID=3109348 RepID=UPI00300A41F8